MRETNLDRKCKMCKSMRFGEEFVNEGMEIDIFYYCGYSGMMEGHKEIDNGGANGS